MNSSKIYSLALSGFVKHPSSGEQIFIFYKLKTDSTSMRLVKENYFIKLFSPKLNKH